jgi:cobyric acid synthase
MVLDALRLKKSLPVFAGASVSYSAQKEAAYDRLAELVRANLDMDLLRRVMGLTS